MSEDFCWVNVERKEFISPIDLGYSGHSHGSSYRDNDVLRALRETYILELLRPADKRRRPIKI